MEKELRTLIHRGRPIGPRFLRYRTKEETAAMTEQELILFFEDLHRHPELGMEETRTTEKIRQALTAAAIEIYPSGLPTGLIAVIRGNRPGSFAVSGAWSKHMLRR